MKKLLIIILSIPLLIRAQNPIIYGKTNTVNALDLDGSAEYDYVNYPTGLDLNSPNYLSGDNTAFTSTVGNWSGLTYSSNKATFSSNATLATSYLSSAFVSGHNYTVQLKAKTNGILGSELVTNGNFDSDTWWTLGVSTTIIGGVAHITGNGAFVANMTKYGLLTATKSYSVTFTILNYVSGSIKAQVGTVGGTTRSANGTYTEILTTDSPTFALVSGASQFVGDIDNVSIKEITYSPLKIKVGTDSTSISTTGTETTYAYTFNYDSGTQIELIGNGVDTYTIDDIDVSEAYDLEIEGYFKANNIATTQYILSTNTGDNIRLGLTSSKLYFRPDNSQSSSYVYSSTLSSNTWYKYKVLYNRLTKVASCYINNTLDNGTQSTSSAWLYRENTTGLRVGLMSTTYFSGLIGWTDIKLKNGLGAIVNETKYDWKGSASTFLNDKKGSNNLTGVNVTLPDVVKYPQGKYK